MLIFSAFGLANPKELVTNPEQRGNIFAAGSYTTLSAQTRKHSWFGDGSAATRRHLRWLSMVLRKLFEHAV
jgi:hypothetical protein